MRERNVPFAAAHFSFITRDSFARVSADTVLFARRARYSGSSHRCFSDAEIRARASSVKNDSPGARGAPRGRGAPPCARGLPARATAARGRGGDASAAARRISRCARRSRRSRFSASSASAAAMRRACSCGSRRRSSSSSARSAASCSCCRTTSARRVPSEIRRRVSSVCSRPLFQGIFPLLAAEIFARLSGVCGCPARCTATSSSVCGETVDNCATGGGKARRAGNCGATQCGRPAGMKRSATTIAARARAAVIPAARASSLGDDLNCRPRSRSPSLRRGDAASW